MSVTKSVNQKMDFNDLIPGASVRYTVIGGVKYLSVRDFIMAVCQKNINDAGAVWRNLSDEVKSEVQHFLLNYKFHGKGQQDQPVITFPGSVTLMMSLPGDIAKKSRSKATEILVPYCAGDPTLIADINANAQSTSPIAQMARESLGIRR